MRSETLKQVLIGNAASGHLHGAQVSMKEAVRLFTEAGMMDESEVALKIMGDIVRLSRLGRSADEDEAVEDSHKADSADLL